MLLKREMMNGEWEIENGKLKMDVTKMGFRE